MADYATISASENGNDSTDESTSSRILSMIPSTVNLDIFDPSVAQSPKDRILLIAEYCQSVSLDGKEVINNASYKLTRKICSGIHLLIFQGLIFLQCLLSTRIDLRRILEISSTIVRTKPNRPCFADDVSYFSN